MASDLERAKQTAVNAAKAVIKIYDFAASVLEELAKAVDEESELKLGRYPLYNALMDARVIRRHTKSRSLGESKLCRYIFSRFSLPQSSGSELDRGPLCVPFILVSLVNKEHRPPEIVYGVIEKIEGKEDDRVFCQYFLLWLNECLNEICGLALQRDYGWQVKEAEVSGRAEASRLRANVSFQRMPLLDINEDNLPDRARTIAEWFKSWLSLD